MKWPKGTAALSVALFGRTLDLQHEEGDLSVSASLAEPQGEYVLLGAGPVGLWTAVQIKLRLPSASIVVYEKRAVYTREYMVRLGSDALWWSVGQEETEIQEMVSVQSKGQGMKLKELETLLRGLAERLGVRFVQQNIVDGHQLISLHPDALAIIGADGRHSILRETLIRSNGVEKVDGLKSDTGGATADDSAISGHGAPEAELQRQRSDYIDVRTLQHTIYVNFHLEGDDAAAAHALTGGALQNIAFNAADSILHAGSHPVRLVVGRARDGRVPITAIFFIDAAAASSMVTCSRRSPEGPGRIAGDDRVPPSLAQDVTRYLRERFPAGAVRLDALELVYVAIDRYCARAVAEARGGRLGIFLVGDACFGVPYFRALTNGLKCGSTLAQYLAGGGGGGGGAAAVRAYRWYVYRLWRQALSAAEATALGSAALGGIIALGQGLTAGAEDAELAGQGYGNHAEADPGSNPNEGAGGGGHGGGGGGWEWTTRALMRPVTAVTGKEEYEFGDVTRAALWGGRKAVGATVRGGVEVAAAALHGFVGLTGIRL